MLLDRATRDGMFCTIELVGKDFSIWIGEDGKRKDNYIILPWTTLFASTPRLHLSMNADYILKKLEVEL